MFAIKEEFLSEKSRFFPSHEWLFQLGISFLLAVLKQVQKQVNQICDNEEDIWDRFSFVLEAPFVSTQ